MSKPPLGELLKDHMITLVGCDNITQVQILLTQDQVEFVQRLCEKTEEISEFQCQPTMRIQKVLHE
jgi:hypothetical protein